VSVPRAIKIGLGPLTRDEVLKELKFVVSDLRHVFSIQHDRLVTAEEHFKDPSLFNGERDVNYTPIELIRLRRDTKHDQDLISRAIKNLEYIIRSKEDALAMESALGYHGSGIRGK